MLKLTLKFAGIQMSKHLQSEDEYYAASRFLTDTMYNNFRFNDRFREEVQELIGDGIIDVDEDYSYEEGVCNYLSEIMTLREI